MTPCRSAAVASSLDAGALACPAVASGKDSGAVTCSAAAVRVGAGEEGKPPKLPRCTYKVISMFHCVAKLSGKQGTVPLFTYRQVCTQGESRKCMVALANKTLTNNISRAMAPLQWCLSEESQTRYISTQLVL